MITMYTLSLNLHDGRSQYNTTDGLFDIRYHGSDNTWKLRSATTGTTLMTVKEAKDTPYSSPERYYYCIFGEGSDAEERYW